MRHVISVLLLSLVSVGAQPAAVAESKSEAPRLDRWLVLGPAALPLPVFHDADEGGYDLEDLLEAEVFAGEPLQPRADEEVAWFSGEALRWSERSGGKRGKLSLAVPQGVARDQTAVAFLAGYLSTGDWVELELEVLGRHPRSAWLDGEEVTRGGEEDEDETVEHTLELAPGKHLLLIRTVRDPERDSRWNVGAKLSFKSEETPTDVEWSLVPARQIEIRDILEPPQITSLAVSPDGLRLACSVRRILPGTSDAESWIEIRETSGGKPVAVSWQEDLEVEQVDWSPDGKYVSYLARSSDGSDDNPAAVYLIEHASLEVSTLLDWVDHLGGYRWSPDGRHVAYWTTEAAEEDERGVKRLEGLMDRWSDFRDKRYLHVVTVPGGIRRQLTAGDTSTELAAFSRDGHKVLFTRQIEDLTQRPYSIKQLWELDLRTGSAVKLRDFRWLNTAAYSPEGDRLLILAQASEFGDVGVDLPSGAVSNSYDGQLFIWNPATDQVDPITRRFDPAVTQAVWSHNDGQIYLVASDRDFVRLFRYDVSRRGFETLESGSDVVEAFDLAERAATGGAIGSSPWEPQRLAVIDLERQTARTLDHPADDWFAEVGRGSVESWDFTASSGRTIPGRVYLPPGFDPQRKYPCIVNYYGGTSPINRAFGGRYPKEWWSAHGYVVYVLQPSGATGFGQPSSALHVNDWGKTTADEILEGTRKFLEAHPYVDAERVGCIGASYGGFMTMLLVTQTDLFATAVAHAGISSLSSYWGEGYWGYSYSSVATADSFPWNRKDIYVEQSPLFRADQARVPILLTHGRSDSNVPVGESDAFYIALKMLGHTVEYVQIEGQGHWIMDHEKRQLWSSTLLAWFDTWLRDRPTWWKELYP